MRNFQNILLCGALFMLLGAVGLSVRFANLPRAANSGNRLEAAPLGTLSGHSVGQPTEVHDDQDESIQVIQIEDIPFLEKKPDFGGEACVAMYLRRLGLRVDQDFVFDQAGVDPLEGRGCMTKELAQAVTNIGLDPGPVWYAADDEGLKRFWADLRTDLRKKIPSVVCRWANGAQQFVLVTGVEIRPQLHRCFVTLNDPASAEGENQQVPMLEFLLTCKLSPDSPSASYVRIGLRPTDRLDAPPARATGFTDADFAQHIRQLKKELPNDDFHIVLQKPFVVVGDQSASKVASAATGTVKWAVDRIKQDYFSRDPEHIINVWLFKDKTSYEKHNQLLFKTKPTTPYGYYSPQHRVLVMNISTGGGTLVHEIVHPFMESNFAACPSWFNEGLASLYEQSSDKNGHIIGSTNWRLRGLQLAIADDRVPSFEELCSTTRREFYEGTSTNYAQARYLCYFLQEQGKLVDYYHAFVKNAKSDPTGYATLKKTLGRDDMDEFKTQWEAYVMKLRFP